MQKKGLNITIKVYEGDYKGLIRAEVEFISEHKANSFKPLSWFGEEIKNSKLGKDSKLMQLTQEEFERLLENAETLEQAVYREIAEELGIKKSSLRLVGKGTKPITFKFREIRLERDATKYIGSERHFFGFKFIGLNK